MGALYNDIEAYAAKLLNFRIQDGWLPAGAVSTEDIRVLCDQDLSNFDHVHLFAGIGGFPLAARTAGVPDDFKLFTAGFPCQPFSNAGARAGTQDNRYLWPQTLAALKSHRPDVAILENVAGLASMAFPSLPTLLDIKTYRQWICDYFYRKRELGVLHQICEDIEQAGYTLQPIIVPACAVDAKHRRDRIWIVCINNNLAYANRARQSQQTRVKPECGMGSVECSQDVANTKSGRRGKPRKSFEAKGSHSSQKPQLISRNSTRSESHVCDSLCSGLEGKQKARDVGQSWQKTKQQSARSDRTQRRCEWSPEPAVGRVVNGLSGRVDRIKGLGNAIVSQVAAETLSLILEALGIEPVFVFPFGEAA